ncbi:hypothetical protein P280DRAFT_253163 [Massarina eburnea CBS 473.64]|uniref:Uncharacterized protein n=1 Tax=Massarina eburnea CBS 473.64 TaxID=1395130 RepID=A0A6A6S896_9PLEO|nr:hypothetical protein P280DRAFT_253163 [Massarina eburnea CBS 473.64]
MIFPFRHDFLSTWRLQPRANLLVHSHAASVYGDLSMAFSLWRFLYGGFSMAVFSMAVSLWRFLYGGFLYGGFLYGVHIPSILDGHLLSCPYYPILLPEATGCPLSKHIWSGYFLSAVTTTIIRHAWWKLINSIRLQLCLMLFWIA